MSILFYSNCSNPQHGLAILKSVRVPTQRDLPIIIYISVDFLQQLLRGIFRLQSLMDLLSFYFGFNFFSDIKRVQYRTGIEPSGLGVVSLPLGRPARVRIWAQGLPPVGSE